MKNFIETVYIIGRMLLGLLILALLVCFAILVVAAPFLAIAWGVVAVGEWVGCGTYSMCSALAVVFAGFALMPFACGGRG